MLGHLLNDTVKCNIPLPIVSSSHTLLIDGSIQFLGIGEDSLMVDDDGLDDLVDMRLAGDLVLTVGCGHECGAETYGQVVRVHHILIAVLGQAKGWMERSEVGQIQQREEDTTLGTVFQMLKILKHI